MFVILALMSSQRKCAVVVVVPRYLMVIDRPICPIAGKHFARPKKDLGAETSADAEIDKIFKAVKIDGMTDSSRYCVRSELCSSCLRMN